MIARQSEHSKVVRVFLTRIWGSQAAPFTFFEKLNYDLNIFIRKSFGKKPPPLSLAILMFSDMLEAVEALHKQGIYHRDIKIRHNVLLDSKNRIKLTDFGLATMEACSSDVVGTQVKAGLRSTYQAAKADIYALGLTSV